MIKAKLLHLWDRVQWWAAYKIPRKGALYCFVRVYATLGSCGEDYVQAYSRWEAGEGR